MMKSSLLLALSFALVLLLTLGSCGKDNDLPALENTVEKTVSLAFDDGEAPPEQMTDGREGNNCRCEYQIVEVNNSTPPAGYHFEYVVTSVQTCVENVNCSYFTFQEGSCEYFLTPGCFGNLPADTPKPTSWLPFNCQVPGYSTLDIGLAGYNFWNTICIPHFNEIPTGYVKIRVRCSDSAPLVCGLGQSYVSSIITLPIGGDEYTINLSGCGCQIPL